MSKHTPGPWYVGVLEDAANVCYVGSLEVSTDGVDPLEYDVSADARLIAAAPDMLKMLEDIALEIRRGQDISEWYSEIADTIEKAKGEQG